MSLFLTREADGTTPATYALVIKKVFKGSPADRAGLGGGDVILAIDGKPIPENLAEAVVAIKGADGKPGKKVVLLMNYYKSVNRDDLTLTTEVWRRGRGKEADVLLRSLKGTYMDFKSELNKTVMNHLAELASPSYWTTSDDIHKRYEESLTKWLDMVLESRTKDVEAFEGAR